MIRPRSPRVPILNVEVQNLDAPLIEDRGDENFRSGSDGKKREDAMRGNTWSTK